MKFEPGEIIRDKYVIIKLIGSGSFGTIYQGMFFYKIIDLNIHLNKSNKNFQNFNIFLISMQR